MNNAIHTDPGTSFYEEQTPEVEPAISRSTGERVVNLYTYDEDGDPNGVVCLSPEQARLLGLDLLRATADLTGLIEIPGGAS